MAGNLSHDLPELITSGNRVLRADTLQPVLLRGVNRSGLEYAQPGEEGFLASAGLSADEIRHIASEWRCNVLRLPFNQQRVLRGANGRPAEEYLSAIDQVISWAAGHGVYTILDLQWIDTETVYGCTSSSNGPDVPNHVPPLPNPDTISLWNTLALRYRDEPAVLFDLFNEPHHRLADDCNPIHLIDADGRIVESDTTSVGATEWLAWATRLVTEIRRVRPAGLILVSGVDWGFDLREIRIDAPNIIYSAHIYPNRKRSEWRKALGYADEVPVFIGEWGGTESDLKFGGRLARLMRSKGLGWTAWSWVDHPRLIEPLRAPDYRPTTFGGLVRSELRR